MKTDQETNKKFERQAMDKLFKVSSSLKLDDHPEIDISKLKEIFDEATRTMRDNPPDKYLYNQAETLFYCCVNVARCVLIDDPQANYIFIDDKTYCLEPLDQFDNTIRNYKSFMKYKENHIQF